MRRSIWIYFFPFFILINYSCVYFQKPELEISPINWTGEIISFVDLDDTYKRSNNFNKIWSKVNSSRYRPYYKFLGKNYKIIGKNDSFDHEFLIIEDLNGRRYKMKIDYEKSVGYQLPSYLLFEDTRIRAMDMIGSTIWLNDIYDPLGFYTYADYNFSRFEKVEIKDMISFQNSDFDYPIWFRIATRSGYEGFVRYNGNKEKIGKQDFYYVSDPLPVAWGKKTINLILSKKIEVGMSDNQVRISIGNPSDINTTSSRHGVSEQWIYQDNIGNRTYLQFEYGILKHINR